ncbi:glycosyltransferase family 2 protein [Shewanella surugensis]|uniref:Glycosyltransferase family 2 protein n=1 Tax=Shewanella surugensis TaxID=212020 RepID=A0ABT0LJH6_9GAMM|nr:glycosyltransferase family 2 protein [Shewanella surugensis]MCL1127452.1 glycosyltransferase family 2 protein [Shewanella surugensis]
MSSCNLTIVVPVYNEQENISVFIEAIKVELASIYQHLDILFVNDGSTDNTVNMISAEIVVNDNISLIDLARNFGKEAAMTAGLKHARGDAVVIMDVDLQDPPAIILEFFRLWRTGEYDTVYGVRVDRSADTVMKRCTAGGFYKLFNMLSHRTKLPENTGDFRLINRKVIDALNQMPERNRFMKGMFAWTAFRAIGVPFERPERNLGCTKFNYWSLWNFALDGILSFTSWPLRVWSYIGFGISFFAFLYASHILIDTLFLGIKVPGYASIMSVILFLGGVQLISLGVIGEYIGRIFTEIKQRPIYLIDKVTGQYQRQDTPNE